MTSDRTALPGLTQTSLETGFVLGIKRLKSRVLVQKPGFLAEVVLGDKTTF